jgi:hypothetical protein
MRHLSELRGKVSKTLGRGERMSLVWCIAVGGVFWAWTESVSRSVSQWRRYRDLCRCLRWSARWSHKLGLAT